MNLDVIFWDRILSQVDVRCPATVPGTTAQVQQVHVAIVLRAGLADSSDEIFPTNAARVGNIFNIYELHNLWHLTGK